MAEILRWCGVTASHYREKSPKRKARPIHARFQNSILTGNEPANGFTLSGHSVSVNSLH